MLRNRYKTLPDSLCAFFYIIIFLLLLFIEIRKTLIENAFCVEINYKLKFKKLIFLTLSLLPPPSLPPSLSKLAR